MNREKNLERQVDAVGKDMHDRQQVLYDRPYDVDENGELGRPHKATNDKYTHGRPNVLTKMKKSRSFLSTRTGDDEYSHPDVPTILYEDKFLVQSTLYSRSGEGDPYHHNAPTILFRSRRL